MSYAIKVDPVNVNEVAGYIAGLARDGRIKITRSQRAAVRWPDEERVHALHAAEAFGGHVVRLRPRPRPPVAHPDVQAQLDAGSLIGAIKAHRALTGCGLKEAKDYVEALPGAAPVLERIRAGNFAPAPTEPGGGAR